MMQQCSTNIQAIYMDSDIIRLSTNMSKYELKTHTIKMSEEVHIRLLTSFGAQSIQAPGALKRDMHNGLLVR